MPQITKAEISQLISIFENKIGGYSVIFNKDENGEYDFKIYKGDSGADAYWSGSIILEQDYYVDWKFSLVNGAIIENATFKLNESNRDICQKIFDIYDIWSQKISKFIRTDFYMSMSQPEDSREEIVQGGEEEEDMSLSESRSLKGRKTIIDSSSNRMKRLAGL
jgi:hypothetical protein